MTAGSPAPTEREEEAVGSAPLRGDRWAHAADVVLNMRKGRVLAVAAAMLALIALIDSQVEENISLGLMYVFPVLLAAVSLRRWQIVLMAIGCGLLREHFSAFSWEPLASGRLASSTIAFSGIGLLLNEVLRNRRATLQHYRELADQVARRREMESQLETVVESTPAAIVTVDGGGRIRLANQAAGELFGTESGLLIGQSVAAYLPTLAEIATESDQDRPFRTAANCRGIRADGEHFLACVWFATYAAREGRHVAAVITDASDDLRGYQESSLQSLLRSTRVLVGSVSHEIRNMCAAISVVHANLGRIPGVAQTEDYSALGTLSQGLARLATVELQTQGETDGGCVNVHSLLEEFRIVVQPTLRAESIELVWEVERDLPLVSGDHHSLLQVLLNLSRNSVRAMEQSWTKRLSIRARTDGEDALIRFSDTGKGVRNPDRLFQAFQEGADVIGLGLFISRALVRSSGGEIYHEASKSGCTMCIRLRAWNPARESSDGNE